ncbi:MAG: 50S ribosomal protein L25 [Acidimicrobiales bacterium]
MAETLVLSTTTGRAEGSASSRRLRREGKVPGVVYGLGVDPVSISVEWPDLRAVLTTDAGINAIITLDVDGDQQLSIVKDLQRHPVRRDVVHIDFIRVDPDAEVSVDVPLVLIGEAKELEQANGMVDQAMFSLTIWSKLLTIPTEIEVDVSALTVGDSVRVEELVLPSGVRTDVDPDEAVAIGTVTRSTLEAIAAEEAAEAAAEAAESEEGEAGDADADDGESSGDSGDGE